MYQYAICVFHPQTFIYAHRETQLADVDTSDDQGSEFHSGAQGWHICHLDGIEDG